MTLGRNGVLRYGHFGEFLEFFWDRMADLGLIDSKRGLYIKINVNNGQNKFEVHISKMWPKWHLMAQNRPAPLWRARFPWP